LPEIDVYLTEGFVPVFYVNLERLSRSGYSKYSVDDCFEAFYDGVRTKLEELLMANIYDAAKGPFVRFVNAVIRNEATKINSKNSHRILYDDHEHMSETLYSAPDTVHPSRDSFLDYAKAKGVNVPQEKFTSSLVCGEISPLVFAYLWLLQKGGGYALGV